MGINKRLPPSTVRRRSVRRTKLRKLSSKLRKALHRLPHVGVAFARNPRSSRRPRSQSTTADTGDLAVSGGGAASRNFVFAARSVHFHGGLGPVIGVTMVFLAVVTGFGAYSLNASKATTTHLPSMLARGQQFTLDVAIAPFRFTSVAAPNGTTAQINSATRGCKDIADTLSTQLANDAKTRFEKQFGNLEVAVWRPDQLDASLLKDDDLLAASKKLATGQQLDLVVIGNVACDGNRVVVTPSVAVSPELGGQLAELNTIRDMNALSSPIVWSSPGGMLSALSEQLASRINLAVRLSLSLERYSRGMSGDYLSAANMAEALLPKFV